MKRARLIQLTIHPVVVADDGETLETLNISPLTVTAADWPRFATDIWPGLLAAAEAQINSDEIPFPTNGAAPDLAPNRPARRAKTAS